MQSTACAGLTSMPRTKLHLLDVAEQIARFAVLAAAPADEARGVLEELGPVHGMLRSAAVGPTSRSRLRHCAGRAELMQP